MGGGGEVYWTKGTGRGKLYRRYRTGLGSAARHWEQHKFSPKTAT